MIEKIAPCGVDCSKCPAYIATKEADIFEINMIAKKWSNGIKFKPEEIYCNGCKPKGNHFIWCYNCGIRDCCKEKGYKNCAFCKDYVCNDLKRYFEKVSLAKERLDKIRERFLNITKR